MKIKAMIYSFFSQLPTIIRKSKLDYLLLCSFLQFPTIGRKSKLKHVCPSCTEKMMWK
jgi:hypothetical protein